VVRRVEVEDRLCCGPVLVATAELLAAGTPWIVGIIGDVGVDIASELGTTQRASNVGVSRQNDEAERRRVDRRLIAQPVVERIRVGAKRWIERVEQRLVHLATVARQQALGRQRTFVPPTLRIVSTVEIVPLEQHITMLRLSRPERLNAISFQLVGDLYDAFDQVGGDPDCRVVILTGSGRGFCAGLDLKDWGEPPAPGMHRHMNANADGQAFVSNLVAALQATPQVVIAAINGPAFGGGLALSCASDIRIASSSARFCSASIRTGLSGCEMGITYTLPRLIGNARAFDLILSGREISAGQALDYGLVSAVVDDDSLIDEAIAYARRMVTYTATGLRTTKQVLWQNVEAPSLDAALTLEINAQMRIATSTEVADYMAAYRTATTGPK